ncbi:MAG: 2-amino-4-hydroxy-6-hydroxymethyldihydropteridine diphosphokinase [Lachnospiraceae bacterium]|nr:2-amino-4-hydroxy-6-hydroxymethyldihydropteridine diphosphokinase [Lachnospiraceae bacterium]
MDKISIKGLEVFAHHGVFEEERRLGQNFIVDLELFLDLSLAGESDDLRLSVDYGKVCRFVECFMRENTYDLIESAAERMAQALLLEYREQLKEVEITIEKPNAPVGLPHKGCSVTVHRGWHTAFISAGSNMGDKRRYLEGALEAFCSHHAFEVVAVSDIFETAPYGYTDQDDFLNMAFEIRTLVSPQTLLGFCKELEARAGRRKTERWGPRTLDLDIVFYDEAVINSDEGGLTIPHPDMRNRFFVLYPLRQIAPGYMHPIYKKTVLQLLEELIEKNGAEPERRR